MISNICRGWLWPIAQKRARPPPRLPAKTRWKLARLLLKNIASALGLERCAPRAVESAQVRLYWILKEKPTFWSWHTLENLNKISKIFTRAQTGFVQHLLQPAQLLRCPLRVKSHSSQKPIFKDIDNIQVQAFEISFWQLDSSLGMQEFTFL